MRERDRELIAALAERSLEDETEARALLDASAEARSEYRLQVEALGSLRGVERAALSDDERAILHRDIWSRLRADDAKSRSGAGIYGWSLAAAAVFVVVGLAAVLGVGMLGQQGATDEFAEVSEELGGAETTTDRAFTDQTFAAGDADTFGGEAAGPISPATRRYLDLEADRLRSSDHSTESAAPAPDHEDCLIGAGLPGHEVVAVLDDASEPGEEEYLAAVPTGVRPAPGTSISFVDAATCEHVYTAD